MKQCSDETPSTEMVSTETASTMTAYNELMSRNGNSVATMLPTSFETEVRVPQLEEWNHLSAHFKEILKKYSLEDCVADDFCFINKYPFDVHCENPQKDFRKESKFVVPS